MSKISSREDCPPKAAGRLVCLPVPVVLVDFRDWMELLFVHQGRRLSPKPGPFKIPRVTCSQAKAIGVSV